VQPEYFSISTSCDHPAKVSHPIWGNIVSSNTNDILIRSIGRCIECETCFSRKHTDELLLWHEFPRQLLRPVCIEMNFDSTSIFDWNETFRFKSTGPDFGGSSESRGCTKHPVKRNSSVACTYCCNYLRDVRCTGLKVALEANWTYNCRGVH